MKVVLSLVAVLALAVGFSLTALDGASAQCVAPCGAVLVPAPNPIPLRRLVVRRAPAVVAPCGVGCVNGAAAYAAPPPCGQGGCGGTAFVYYPKRVYASVSYTHLRAHETDSYLVCRLLLEKKKQKITN